MLYSCYIMQKEIREKIKNLREKLTETEIQALSEKITEKVLTFDFINDYKTFMVYNSIKGEVSTEKIINYLLKNNKTVCYPVIKGENIVISKPLTNEFIKGNFGVLEPKEYEVLDKVDVVFVPLIACDKNKNRIGFGKGYYDRFLKDKTCLKVGVCYDFQVVENIVPSPFDIPLDIIITENNIIGD